MVQIDGVQGYDEDQIALVIPDFSNFVAQVPMIFRTPMISHIMNMIKEREIDALATLWVNAQAAYQWVTATVEDDKVAAGVLDLTEYDDVVITKESKTVDAFSSKIIHTRTKTAFTGSMLNVITQALCAEEVTLLQG